MPPTTPASLSEALLLASRLARPRTPVLARIRAAYTLPAEAMRVVAVSLYTELKHADADADADAQTWGHLCALLAFCHGRIHVWPPAAYFGELVRAARRMEDAARSSANQTQRLPVDWSPSFPAATLPPVRVRYPMTADSVALTERLAVLAVAS